MVLLTGLVLIAIGIACLYLSDRVAHAGPWGQATLDAFGVGFIVGGVVDVLAITGLNQAITVEQSRREYNRQAEVILRGPIDSSLAQRADSATELIIRGGHLIDRSYVNSWTTSSTAPNPKGYITASHNRAERPGRSRPAS